MTSPALMPEGAVGNDRRLEPAPPLREVWRRPLPGMAGSLSTRLLCRALLTVFHRRLVGVRGVEHLRSAQGPFIVALNHSQRPEAILVPTWIAFLRDGRTVHFMADWNFLLIPVVGWIIRKHDPIVVARKDAKPRFLNRFRARYAEGPAPFVEARRRIERGASVGVFPEGTVNRHPTQMLRGYSGTARLSVETGAPVIPGGLRFPHRRPGERVGDNQAFSLEFGPALAPPANRDPDLETVRAFHAQIMTAISTLCGKGWQADARRSKYALDQE